MRVALHLVYGIGDCLVKLSIALVHSPVLNKKGDSVTTNITNFDIHDIARVARTYGAEKYFIINNTQEQLMYAERVLSHWKSGEGSKLNSKRTQALKRIVTAESLDKVCAQFKEKPMVIATAARPIEGCQLVGFRQLRERFEKASDGSDNHFLLLFGTGFGLPEDWIKAHCDMLLEPITGASSDGYNHLSVRSAVSICLDRLLGQW